MLETPFQVIVRALPAHLPTAVTCNVIHYPPAEMSHCHLPAPLVLALRPQRRSWVPSRRISPASAGQHVPSWSVFLFRDYSRGLLRQCSRRVALGSSTLPATLFLVPSSLLNFPLCKSLSRPAPNAFDVLWSRYVELSLTAAHTSSITLCFGTQEKTLALIFTKFILLQAFSELPGS